MSVINDAVRTIQQVFASAQYPDGFLEAYDQLECLASHEGWETFLMREKGGERLYVAKCYDKSVLDASRETDVLRSLRHDGLPAFVGAYQNDRMLCVVRDYVQGTPLDRYAADNALTQAQIVRLCVRLCDILTYLHEHKPPVIHRDIKPQNIIIRDDGAPVLIDFDTARTYKPGESTDTQYLGTRAYAPPEQYGFTQTDCRADIYALGVLMRFLLTGSEKPREGRDVPAPLRRVVAKCTAFAPAQRYGSVAAVRKALLASGKRARRRLALGVALVAAMALLAFAGAKLGWMKPPQAAVAFAEPLIERAVRIQLDKGAQEPITADELENVRALYIFGTDVAKSEDAFSMGLADHGAQRARGEIRSLDDLALMPNLTRLMIAYQALADISRVAQLRDLQSVDFKHTQVADLTPLANMLRLESVILYDTNVSDATVLDSCPRLRFLDLGATLIPSLHQIGGCGSVDSLSLKRLRLDSLDGLKRFERLETLYLSGAQVADASALKNVTTLTTVYADAGNVQALSALLAGSPVKVLVE